MELLQLAGDLAAGILNGDAQGIRMNALSMRVSGRSEVLG